ncbi:BTAD domain-containing putative transcriptional regulator [Streptomyces sp. NPDC096079]|uniref:AfsR/SARP family transcriptional regulator n=1 Tax=Streptomyces sp. NPDC096079 TaxID=3155820 RepID=UPI00332D8D68
MRFGLLGPLTVHDADDRPLAVPTPKSRALLAALLLEPNRLVSRERLAAALWGEGPPATAAAALSNYVSQLRRTLSATGGERLVAVPTGYRLLVHDGELDTERFTLLLAEAKSAQARQDWVSVSRLTQAAERLWRGAPLADAPVSETLRPQITHYEQARVQAREWHFAAELRLGHHHEIVPEVSRWTARYPLHEAFCAQLILALFRSGRQAEALLAFERVRRDLAEELGTDPGRALRDLHRSLLVDDPALRWTAPAVTTTGTAVTTTGPAGAGASAPASDDARVPDAHLPDAAADPRAVRTWAPSQLPADVPDFTGREAEVRTLVELLTPRPDDQCPRMAVVTGMSGVGKTALAVHTARLLRDRFPGGQIFTDLHGFGLGTRQDPHDLLGRFVSDLSDTPAGPGLPIPGDTDGRAALLRTCLTDRGVLMVLDNAHDVEQLLPLLPGSAGCSVLITSRNALPDLPIGARLPLEPLDEGDQRAMLSAFCGADRVLAESGDATRILAACAGLPLALRIVGAKARVRPSWPLRTIAEQLEAGDGRLRALSAGSLSVHTSFASSYRMLRDSRERHERDAARAFRLLSLWRGDGLSLDACAALLDLPARRTAEVLGLLGDVHLLQNPEPGRYRFHDLVGEYAAERSAAEESGPARRAALLRLLTWYTVATEAASATIAPGMPAGPRFGEGPAGRAPRFHDAAAALAWFVQELPDLREAVQAAALSPRPDLAWRLALNLFGYATTYWWTGVWDTCLRSALATARAHDDHEGQAWVLFRLGVAHRMAHRHDASLASLLECLPHFEASGDLECRAGVYSNLSRAYSGTHRPRQALDHARRAIDLFRRSGSGRSEAPLLSGLATAHRAAGELREAEAVYRQVLAMCRELGYLTNIAIALEDLGDTLRARGRRAEALDALTEALALRRRVGDTGGATDTLTAIGRAHAHFGETAAAQACFDEAEELRGKDQSPPRRAGTGGGSDQSPLRRAGTGGGSEA